MIEVDIKSGKKIRTVKKSFRLTTDDGQVVRYATTYYIKQKKINENFQMKVNIYIEQQMGEGKIQYETGYVSYYGLRNLYENTIAKLEALPKEWLQKVIKNLSWTQEFGFDPDAMDEAVDKEIEKFWSDRNNKVKRTQPDPKNRRKGYIDKTFSIIDETGIAARYVTQNVLYSVKSDISPAHNSYIYEDIKENVKNGFLKAEEEESYYGFVNIPYRLFEILEKQSPETIADLRDECRKVAYEVKAKYVDPTILYLAMKRMLGIRIEECEELFEDKIVVKTIRRNMCKYNSMLVERESYI